MLECRQCQLLPAEINGRCRGCKYEAELSLQREENESLKKLYRDYKDTVNRENIQRLSASYEAAKQARAERDEARTYIRSLEQQLEELRRNLLSSGSRVAVPPIALRRIRLMDDMENVAGSSPADEAAVAGFDSRQANGVGCPAEIP